MDSLDLFWQLLRDASQRVDLDGRTMTVVLECLDTVREQQLTDSLHGS